MCWPRFDVEGLRAVCDRYGVVRLDVFGSVARGDAGPGSDVDLLYTLAPGRRLGWEIEDLADELSTVLGARADLVAREALAPRIREVVLKEAGPLFP